MKFKPHDWMKCLFYEITYDRKKMYTQGMIFTYLMANFGVLGSD